MVPNPTTRPVLCGGFSFQDSEMDGETVNNLVAFAVFIFIGILWARGS